MTGNTKIMRLILLAFLIGLLSASAHAVTLTLDDIGEARLIGKFFEFCDCPENASVQDLASGRMDQLFKSVDNDRLNFSQLGKESIWVRLSIMNPYPEPRLRTLLIAHNVGELWEFYHQQGNYLQKMVSGLNHGGSGFYPHFSVNLHPGLNQVFLKLTVSRVSIWFGTEEKVADVTQKQLHFATIMLTIALLITIASLATAILLRETLFYYYAFYTLSSAVFMLVSSNVLIIYDINFFAMTGISFTPTLNLCMAYELLATFLFISYFLKLQSWAPFIRKVLTVFGIGAFTFLVVQGTTGYYNSYILTSVILIYCILITSIFVYSIKKGVGRAKQALLSWSVYVVGVSCSAVLMLGDNPLVGLNLSWITMNLEMLLFGFISLSELYFRQLKLTGDMKHSYEQLKKLVYPQQLDMMKQGCFLEQTMPIKQAEAVILCFDVINGTKIDPNTHHAFFEDFFVKCQAIMSDGIEVDGEHVQLFRVKEMGDGFICSIGFPFNCAVNQEKAAVVFVDRLAKLFNQCIALHLNGEPCGFGIGITSGIVGGFFPRSGIMQYDLYGMAVVLATRYENMRRQFQTQMADGMSIVILQDTVFQKLPETLKSRFQCCQLDQVNFKVRDDPDAKRMWISFIEGPKQTGLGPANSRRRA